MTVMSSNPRCVICFTSDVEGMEVSIVSLELNSSSRIYGYLTFDTLQFVDTTMENLRNKRVIGGSSRSEEKE